MLDGTCLTFHSVWSICTGRIAQLPRASITLDKPILDEVSGAPDAFSGASRVQAGVVTTRMFLQEFASLSELVNDNNYMFFAPKERLTSTRLLDCYNKYQAWYRKLPPALGIEDKRQPEPHTLVLQYVNPILRHRIDTDTCQYVIPHNYCAPFPSDAKSRSCSFRRPTTRYLYRSSKQCVRYCQIISTFLRFSCSAPRNSTHTSVGLYSAPALLYEQWCVLPKPR
jgi:hypothetical protein